MNWVAVSHRAPSPGAAGLRVLLPTQNTVPPASATASGQLPAQSRCQGTHKNYNSRRALRRTGANQIACQRRAVQAGSGSFHRSTPSAPSTVQAFADGARARRLRAAVQQPPCRRGRPRSGRCCPSKVAAAGGRAPALALPGPGAHIQSFSFLAGQLSVEDKASMVLCKPKVLPLKSVTLEKLEKLQRAALEAAQPPDEAPASQQQP